MRGDTFVDRWLGKFAAHSVFLSPHLLSRSHINLTSFPAMPAVVVRQRKAWRRRDGVFLYFEVRTVRTNYWRHLQTERLYIG